MGAQARRGSLMDEAKGLALAYVRSLPAADRVMLVRADAFPTPSTGFETNRATVEDAIRSSQPGMAGLDLAEAFAFAQSIQRMSARGTGEIVYAGAGRTALAAPSPLPDVRNLRLLSVADPQENCGLGKIGLRRASSDADLWEIFVTARNYGRTPQTVMLALQFGNAPAGSRPLNLAPGAEQSATFQYRTRAAGWLEARLMTRDAFPQDDRALLELPSQKPLRVAVFSAQPNLLRPVLSANRRFAATFSSPSAYTSKPEADVVVVDRFRPPRPPELPAIFIEPPADGSPVRVQARMENVPLARWRSDHTLGTGLHTEDLRLESTQVFSASPDDIAIAEVERGPVILARPGARKLVVMGFHPLRSAMRYELATPLLFANVLRWMSPEVFRRWELAAGSVGPQTVTLDSEAREQDIKVLDENQRPMPFSLRGRTVRFFCGAPGTVRVLTANDEIVRSIALPEVPDARWEPPQNARHGVPKSWPAGPASRDLWQILALAGGAGLLAEWLLFGRSRVAILSRPAVLTMIAARVVRKPEKRAV
jgi:hypothetical protein